MYNSPPRNHEILKKIPVPCVGYSPNELLTKKASKTIQRVVTALGYSLSLDGRALLFKMPQHIETGHREIKLDLSWNLLLFWQAFIVPQGYWERKSISSIPELWLLYWPARQDWPTVASVLGKNKPLSYFVQDQPRKIE